MARIACRVEGEGTRMTRRSGVRGSVRGTMGIGLRGSRAELPSYRFDNRCEMQYPRNSQPFQQHNAGETTSAR